MRNCFGITMVIAVISRAAVNTVSYTRWGISVVEQTKKLCYWSGIGYWVVIIEQTGILDIRTLAVNRAWYLRSGVRHLLPDVSGSGVLSTPIISASYSASTSTW